jgi:polysaccharide transporter, PST family
MKLTSPGGASAPLNSLRKNIASLYALQFASYLIPLLLLPWLTRTLGPAGFGRLNFSIAFISYFLLLSDYGFNLSATRSVAVHRDEPAERSRIFWNTVAAKATLAAVGLPLLLALTALIPRLQAERSLLLINFLTVIGAVCTPTWYFMGIERQSVLSTITIVARLSSVPVTYWLVRTPTDLMVAALIPGCVSIVCGLAGCWFLFAEKQIHGCRVSTRDLLQTLGEGWHLFLSTASVSLYQATNTVVLGFVAGSVAVGYYSAAERIVQTAQSLLAPITQSLYPRMSRLMHESRSEAFALLRRILRIQGSLSAVITLTLLLAAPLITELLYGPQFAETTRVLRWLAPIPFLVALSNVFGIQTMLPMGMSRSVSRILLSAGLLNVCLLFALTPPFGSSGTALSVTTTELFVTVVMAWLLRRENVPLLKPGPQAPVTQTS